MAHKVTKAEAVKRGLKTYDGKPCDRGHSGERYTNSDKCIECHKERNKRRKRGKAGKTASTAVAPVAVGAAVVPVTPINADDWQSYADRIAATWRQAVGSIIATGKLLIDAKAKLQHGDFGNMIQTLPFGERAAEMLMAIARHPVLSNPNRGSVLPPSWRTLYELSKLDDDVLLAKIEDHSINAGMERKDVAAITGARHPKTKLRRRSKADERIIEQAEEIEGLKAHIDELEAAREWDFTEVDDETMAKQILGWIGMERVLALIVELKKLIGRSEAAA